MFGFTFDRISIFANYDLLFLGKPSNWFNQSNDFDDVYYFGRLGCGHFSYILDNSLWCTPFLPFWREDEALNGRLLMMRIFYIPILLNGTVAN